MAKAGRLVGGFGEIRLRLVLDAEMGKAHEEFAGVPGTTDVLTFDMTDPEADPIDAPTVALVDGEIRVGRSRHVDADIMVCVDEGKRQAAARGHDLARELLLYSVHGLLHCLGHDDHDDDSFTRMHALEDAILTHIGVGAVFGPAKGDSPSGVAR